MKSTFVHIALYSAAILVVAYLFMLWRYAAVPPFKMAGHYVPADFASPDKPLSWMEMKRSTLVAFRDSVDELGFAPLINSADRSDQHNEAVGGAGESAHKDGYALDISILQDPILIPSVLSKHFPRNGFYATHHHADNHPDKQPATWYG